ncbi:MAG: competence protein ComEC family protein [Prevotella sp.]|jgi:competence protein ComEC|nr:competence protein ComEC family protein [Prevotella sp.]
MKNPLSKVPFLFLLIPLIAGILVRYFFQIQYLIIALLPAGATAMLISYLIPKDKQFNWRWLFGAGVILCLSGIGMATTFIKQGKSEYTFSGDTKIYLGVVADTPQEKPKSTAYRVYLPQEEKQIVCYFQRDSLCKDKLLPGDEFLFQAKIQPFRNMGNPDDFDYVRYMYNQGFSGSAYVTSDSWKTTGKISSSLKYKALRCRQQIMDFYKSLGFNETEYTILSALTLGYQDELTEELKQGFRTTGTVHVLSVSGLHVGIIYMMMSFLLGFIRKGSKYYRLKPVIIIILLWSYAFITGLPPSVLRAGGMLTVFCMAEISGKKSYSMHALFIAAFFMLLISPFSLFDIGFQLSFISVLAILYLHPKVLPLLKTKNKYAKYIWQMFTLSLVAQLATFPVCLYYFGTFPTYFFVTNLLIVPLVTFITYSVGGIIVAKGVSLIVSGWSDYLFYLPVKALHMLVHAMTSIIRFFENLPFASIDNVKISLSDLTLIFTIIVGILIFMIYKKTKALSISLTAILLLFTSHIYMNLNEKTDGLVVYNRRQSSEIKFHGEIVKSEDIDKYKAITFNDKKILILSANLWYNKDSDIKLNINHLILTRDNSLSLYSLNQHLTIKNVIIEGSLSANARKRISKECQKLGIPCHDVVENGAYSLKF